MTSKEIFRTNGTTFKECARINVAKGADYTKGSQDVLANFKQAGKDIGAHLMDGCWIFMNKHYQAITNYVKTKGQNESEPISERIKDLINYLVLLQGLIKENETR